MKLLVTTQMHRLIQYIEQRPLARLTLYSQNRRYSISVEDGELAWSYTSSDRSRPHGPKTTAYPSEHNPHTVSATPAASDGNADPYPSSA
jgi:hypothetical protein